MKKFLLFIYFSSFCFSQIIDQMNLISGKRGDNYRVWIYFKDKAGSEVINVGQETHQRRLEHGSKSDYNWYDLQVAPDYINSIKALGLEVENESRWLNAISVLCSESDIDTILSLSFVKKIEPVKGYKKKLFEIKEDTLLNSRDFDYGDAYTQIEQINVHELHNQGFTGEGVRILLLDTGFDLSHNAFSQINVIDQWDFISNDDQTANESDNEFNINQDSHGTKILSIIAANSPGNLMGTAFDAEFLLAKTEDVSQEWQQEEDDYVAGLEWGEANGAAISSSSLGYADWYSDSDFDGNTAVTTIAIDIAVGLGVVCVTAVGNGYMVAPADADSVIAVGAVYDSGEIAYFSTRGPTFDGRVKPEVCAQGVGVWVVSGDNDSEFVNIYNGTSASTPLVSGAAGLIKQARPSWSPMAIREAIMMTASMADSINNDYGYGIMNASAAVEYWATSEINQKYNYPKNYAILKTYPNPFNPSLNIDINILKESMLDISIFSYNGKFIENIFNKALKPSIKNIHWSPNALPSGIYFVRLAVNNNQTVLRKVTYIK